VSFQNEPAGAQETFVIYDLETTGLYPDSDEIIQIAAVRYRSGRLCPEDAFASFARPRRPISAFIESYTGIGNHHVRDAARPEEVLGAFARWAEDATLIAHNGHRFDSKFLTATCLRHALPAREVPCIDSIRLSKLAFGTARGTGHSLDRLIDRLRIRTDGIRRHDARGDVAILARAVDLLRHQLGLDPSFAGVPRHTTLLPETTPSAKRPDEARRSVPQVCPME